MSFLLNLVLLPLKLLLLPFWIFAGILAFVIQLILGIGLGVVGIILFVVLLPLSLVGLLFGGGFNLLLLIGVVGMAAAVIPSLSGAIFGGISRFMSRWA